MEADFWHDSWASGKTGWHLEDTHALLLRHFSQLKTKEGERIFVPLCGKSLDIKWLLEQGLKVVGVELNEDAVKALFESLSLKPTVETVGPFVLYRADHVHIYVGDIFLMDKATLGRVDAVYDRAAIVAFPSSMRERYTILLGQITEYASQLVISFDYDQSLMDGPPFSVNADLIHSYYAEQYDLRLLESVKLKRSNLELEETVWLLQGRDN